MITIDELKTLISRVGRDMSEVEAKALIGQADKDQNKGIDFSEFAKLWEALHGEGEVAQYFYLEPCFVFSPTGGYKERVFQTCKIGNNVV